MNDYSFNNSDCNEDWLNLIAQTREITTDPEDYYAGRSSGVPCIPENILMFRRQAPILAEAPSLHHRFLLIACLQGAGTVLVDDKVAKLTPHSALLVLPHQFHHYADFTEPPMLWLFITFELRDLELFEMLRGRPQTLSPLQQRCLGHAIKQYAGAYAGSQMALSLALLLENMCTRAAKPSESRPASARPLIQTVTAYVHTHISRPLCIQEVARAAGLSESHLRSRFRALAGIGLGTYIRQLRLHRAKVLVSSSSLRMGEIAERCGYDSPYSFSRAFSHATGMSPSQYRVNK